MWSTSDFERLTGRLYICPDYPSGETGHQMALGPWCEQVVVEEDEDDGEEAEAHHEGEDDGDEGSFHDKEQRLELLSVLGWHRSDRLEPDERQVYLGHLAEDAACSEEEEAVSVTLISLLSSSLYHKSSKQLSYSFESLH